MKQHSFKKTARRLTIEATAVVLLVGYKANFPKGQSFADEWQFVLTHWPLLLHVVVGTLIVAETVVMLVRSWRAQNDVWMTYAGIALLSALLAWGSGEWYVASQKSIALDMMSVGWLGVLVCSAVAWYRAAKDKL